LENIASAQNVITTQGLTTAKSTLQQQASAKQNVMMPPIMAANNYGDEKAAVTHDANSETETNWLNQVISNE
jgi:hypothetical protein